MVKLDLAGGASGAVSGGAAGSTFGPWGTAIGSVIGGVTGLFGGKKRKKKKSTLDKYQKDIFKQDYAALKGEGPNAEMYGFNPDKVRELYQKKYAEPAVQQFQEEIVPSITGAYRGANLQNSSYLGSALSKAGTNVQKDLDAKLMQMLYDAEQKGYDRRQTAVDRLLNLETQAYQPQGKGGAQSFFEKIIPYAADFLIKKYGGPSASTQQSGSIQF